MCRLLSFQCRKTVMNACLIVWVANFTNNLDSFCYSNFLIKFSNKQDEILFQIPFKLSHNLRNTLLGHLFKAYGIRYMDIPFPKQDTSIRQL